MLFMSQLLVFFSFEWSSVRNWVGWFGKERWDNNDGIVCSWTHLQTSCCLQTVSKLQLIHMKFLLIELILLFKNKTSHLFRNPNQNWLNLFYHFEEQRGLNKRFYWCLNDFGSQQQQWPKQIYSAPFGTWLSCLETLPLNQSNFLRLLCCWILL